MKAWRENIQKILSSRGQLIQGLADPPLWKAEEEGGCGVTGFACSIPVGGRHIIEPSRQMNNRGNGKGGGIAAVGLCPESLGVSKKILEEDYLLQIAFLDPEARPSVEGSFLSPFLEVHDSQRVPTVEDFREVEGLEVKPPDAYRYFVRVKKEVIREFGARNQFNGMDPRKMEDEFIFQNSFQLNRHFYASLGENYPSTVFRVDPEIPRYQDGVRTFITKHRGIPSLFGRWLPLPDAASPSKGPRNRAWRRALNFPMQAGGQEVTVLAMTRLQRAGVPLCLQVHDELCALAPERDAERTMQTMKHHMTQTCTLRAPLHGQRRVRPELGGGEVVAGHWAHRPSGLREWAATSGCTCLGCQNPKEDLMKLPSGTRLDSEAALDEARSLEDGPRRGSALPAGDPCPRSRA